MIIDVRARLPLRRRIGSDLCTAGLWGLCGWLLVPTLASVSHARTLQPHQGLASGFSMPALNGVLGILAVAVGIWVWMQSRRRKTVMAAQPDYAQRFGLTEAQLVQYRASQTCTVHHNEAGDIVGIDAVAPLVLVSDTTGETLPLPAPAIAEQPPASFATAA
jgi:poly-beta-1,6-N-acetyl-D-glucosamine biosynthesis protein PgaD